MGGGAWSPVVTPERWPPLQGRLAVKESNKGGGGGLPAPRGLAVLSSLGTLGPPLLRAFLHVPTLGEDRVSCHAVPESRLRR